MLPTEVPPNFMTFIIAVWYYLFLFMLPYIVTLIIQKNKSVLRLIIIIIIMFLVGFINPYTYENVFFPFIAYNPVINSYIQELNPTNIVGSDLPVTLISIFFYVILIVELLIYIYYKKGKLELRHLLLFGGTTLLALAYVRNIPIFIIATLPILASYLKNSKFSVKNNYVNTKPTWIIMIILIIIVSLLNPNRLVSGVKKGGDFLNKNYDKNIVVYTNLDYGSYIEYLGFHSYFDTRAEVFLKKANKKEDIFLEAMSIEKYCFNYEDFIEKYKFTHMVVNKRTCLYQLLKDNTKIIFKDKEYVIFEL